MGFSVQGYIDDHTLTANAETAEQALAMAVEWQVADGLTDVSISDGVKSYSVAEFSSFIANIRLS